MVGLIALAYPIYQSYVVTKHTKWIAIKGSVKSRTFPVYVYAVSNVDALQASRPFKVDVPLLPREGGKDCRVLFICGTTYLEDLVDLNGAKDGVVVVKEKDFGQQTIYESLAAPAPEPQDFRQD